jgi:hypothetical protein
MVLLIITLTQRLGRRSRRQEIFTRHHSASGFVFQCLSRFFGDRAAFLACLGVLGQTSRLYAFGDLACG